MLEPDDEFELFSAQVVKGCRLRQVRVRQCATEALLDVIPVVLVQNGHGFLATARTFSGAVAMRGGSPVTIWVEPVPVTLTS